MKDEAEVLMVIWGQIQRSIFGFKSNHLADGTTKLLPLIILVSCWTCNPIDLLSFKAVTWRARSPR